MSFGNKRGTTWILLALLSAMPGASRGQDAAKKTPEPKPIAAMGWLVGGVWTADASKLGPGMRRIETRYQWADNDAYIRFTTHFVMDKGTVRQYDGHFFWNPEQSSLAMWYMDAGNAIVQGPVKQDGETLRMTFRAEDFEGRPADLRVDVIRQTNDHYSWRLEEKGPEGWKILGALEYLRVAGS